LLGFNDPPYCLSSIPKNIELPSSRPVELAFRPAAIEGLLRLHTGTLFRYHQKAWGLGLAF